MQDILRLCRKILSPDVLWQDCATPGAGQIQPTEPWCLAYGDLPWFGKFGGCGATAVNAAIPPPLANCQILSGWIWPGLSHCCLARPGLGCSFPPPMWPDLGQATPFIPHSQHSQIGTEPLLPPPPRLCSQIEAGLPPSSASHTAGWGPLAESSLWTNLALPIWPTG